MIKVNMLMLSCPDALGWNGHSRLLIRNSSKKLKLGTEPRSICMTITDSFHPLMVELLLNTGSIALNCLLNKLLCLWRSSQAVQRQLIRAGHFLLELVFLIKLLVYVVRLLSLVSAALSCGWDGPPLWNVFLQCSLSPWSFKKQEAPFTENPALKNMVATTEMESCAMEVWDPTLNS